MKENFKNLKENAVTINKKILKVSQTEKNSNPQQNKKT